VRSVRKRKFADAPLFSSMKEIVFAGIEGCVLLSNESCEVVATTKVGPRILGFRLKNGENILAEIPDAAMKHDMGVWKPYGGHRLWVAPEEMPRTYYPDNDPVQCEVISERAVRLIAPAERITNIQKEMRIALDDTGARLTIEHIIRNCGKEQVELAPWALTIMQGGGTTVIPQEPYRSHDDYLLPARPLVLWHFTDLTDTRWKIGKHLIELSTDSALHEPQKIGVLNKQGWMAYSWKELLFVKEFEYLAGASYPDYGSNCETYTAGDFMEVESLGPMQVLEPGEAATHRERWHLFEGVKLNDDAASRRTMIEDRINVSGL
jgi:hypothetical protein